MLGSQYEVGSHPMSECLEPRLSVSDCLMLAEINEDPSREYWQEKAREKAAGPFSILPPPNIDVMLP